MVKWMGARTGNCHRCLKWDSWGGEVGCSSSRTRVSDRHKGARRLLKKWIVRVKWLLAHLFAQKAKLELVLFVHFISKNCGFQLVDFIKKALA